MIRNFLLMLYNNNLAHKSGRQVVIKKFYYIFSAALKFQDIWEGFKKSLGMFISDVHKKIQFEISHFFTTLDVTCEWPELNVARFYHKIPINFTHSSIVTLNQLILSILVNKPPIKFGHNVKPQNKFILILPQCTLDVATHYESLS